MCLTPGSLSVAYSLGVTLPLFVLTAVTASPRMENFYDTNYDDYYPTLFQRDHREFFVNVDHRHIYCDCSIYGPRANVSAQARTGARPKSEFSPLFSRNISDTMSVQLEQTHLDEIESVDAIDTQYDSSSMTSSTLTDRRQQQQQQLLYVVVPCVVTIIVLVVIITVIIISLLRRRLLYMDKSSDQESVNLTSFGAGQQPVAPITGLQLCAAQQHQLLLDTLTLRHPSDDEQSRSAADKQAPGSNVSVAECTPCPHRDWTQNFTPARKEVTVKCYLDTSSVRAMLVPKTPPS